MRKTWHYDKGLKRWVIPDGDADIIFATEEGAMKYQEKCERMFGGEE